MFKQPYIRRGNPLDFMPDDQITVKQAKAVDALLESCPLYWDAILPEQASKWLDKIGATYKHEPGYICVSTLTHESAKDYVEAWLKITEIVKGMLNQ